MYASILEQAAHHCGLPQGRVSKAKKLLQPNINKTSKTTSIYFYPEQDTMIIFLRLPLEHFYMHSTRLWRLSYVRRETKYKISSRAPRSARRKTSFSEAQRVEKFDTSVREALHGRMTSAEVCSDPS
jgi:hypothetical protein